MADLAPIDVEGSAPTPPPEATAAPVPLQVEPGRVAVVDPEGTLKSIPQENAAKATELGYRPATEAEVYAHQNGALGTAAATAFGAARGATFGLFDPLAVGASRLLEGDQGAEETRKSLALLQEGHPTASFVGEVGGSLAPLAFGAPPVTAAEEVGGSALARLGSRAVMGAARESLIGGAYGLGEQLSEDTLGNHDLVAQKYLSSALKGGIFAAILGAGLHGGGGLVGDLLETRGAGAIERAAGAERPAFRSFGTKLGEVAEEQAAKGLMPSASLAGSELQRLGQTAEEQATRMREIGRTAIEEGISTPGATRAVQAERLVKRTAEVGEELGAIRKSLEKSAVRPSTENVIEQIGPVWNQLAATPFSEDAQRVVRPILDEITERASGKRVVGYRPRIDPDAGLGGGFKIQKPFAIGEELRPMQIRTAGRADRVPIEEAPGLWNRGSKGQILKRSKLDLDAGLGGLEAPIDVLRPSAAKNVPHAIEFGAMDAEAVAASRKSPLGFEEITEPTFESFKQLSDLRIALDEKLQWMRVWERMNGPAPGHAELKQIRGILEGEYERAADAAAKDLGENIGTKYRVTKAIFQDLKTAEKWATKGAARETQNQAVSLTDVIAMGGGVASGHPLGAVALGVANRIRRVYGNQMAAAVADRASKLMGVQRGVENFDRRLQKAVSGFYGGKGGGGGGGPPKGGGPGPKLDAATTKQLRAAVQNPEAMTERVAHVVGASGLQDVAPKLAQAMSNTIMRAANYVRDNIPPEPPPAGFSFGPPKPRPLGPHAQAKLEGVVGALDMDGVLDDIERGRVDRQKIQALAIINPDGHAAIIDALKRHGEEHAAELTHQQEVALSILTGQPIGAIMQPRTIRGFQQAHATSGPPPEKTNPQTKPIGNPSGAARSPTAMAYQSGSDRMEADNGT